MNIKKDLNQKVVLDTSVLMCEEDVLFEFMNTEVIIPFVVYKELNALKENQNKGYIPRRTLQLLKRLSDVRPLSEGVNLKEIGRKENTFVRISYEEDKDIISKLGDTNDFRIIASAHINKATLVSRDVGLLVIGNDFVETKEFLYDPKLKKEYKGYRIEQESSFLISSLYKNKLIEDKWDLYPNEFLILEDACNPKNKVVGIKKKDGIKLCDFENKNFNMKTKPLNLEQNLLLYLLNDEDVKAVTVTGVSGRGKSLLTIDYALSEVQKGVYNSFLYTKSITPVDDNEYLGFYKGGVEEKLEPHLQPLFSSIEYLYKNTIFDKNKSKEERISTRDIYDNLKNNEELQVIPLSDIRGMNINRKIVMLDEAQNTHRHMIKALVSRLTDSSKIIIAGDIEQIDNIRLSMFNNGLSHLIEQGKDEYCVAHITLDIDKKGSKRGRLATFASERL